MSTEIRNKRIILGLDVSTRCIGSTVASLDEDGTVNILEISHLRLKIRRKYKNTNKGLFIKSEQFKNKLNEKYNKYYITDVIIEEPVVNGSNMDSIAMLMKFNGMISQSVRDVLGVIPEYISSHDARKYGCPSLMAIRRFGKDGSLRSIKDIRDSIAKNELALFGSYPFDCSKKYILWNFVSEAFPDIKWEYNTNGELKDDNFEAADSLMCVLGYVNKLRYGNEEPEIVCCNEENEQIEYTVRFCGQTFEKIVELN